MAVTPSGGVDVMDLIENADRELYAAKPGGRRPTRT
jgi:PleD family two-component response regulator